MQGDNDHLCILIDQFEELFAAARRPGADAESRLMADALVALAAQPTPGLYVALTMRSEFLGACARFPGLAEAVNAHQYLLPPMLTTDLLRAIREPARLYGGEVESGLAERLAQDALVPDGLPLVQLALMLMHEDAGPAEGWRLTTAQYPADGLAGMLSRHADAVAAEVAAALPEWPRLVEDLLRALTTVSAEGHALRRPQPLGRLAEVCGAPVEAVARAVDLLRADGVSFLTPRPGKPLAAEDWIDIGHEALIRGWRVLADPLDGWLLREFRNGLVWALDAGAGGELRAGSGERAVGGDDRGARRLDAAPHCRLGRALWRRLEPRAGAAGRQHQGPGCGPRREGGAPQAGGWCSACGNCA